MKWLIVAAALLLASPCFAGMGMGPGPGLTTVIYASSTGFETGYDGWATSDESSLYRSNSNGAHSGSWAVYSPGSAATGKTLTGIINTAGGPFSFYALTSNASSYYGSIAVTVDGVASGLGNVTTAGSWQQKTITLSAGVHTIVFTFQRDTGGFAVLLDGIGVQ